MGPMGERGSTALPTPPSVSRGLLPVGRTCPGHDSPLLPGPPGCGPYDGRVTTEPSPFTLRAAFRRQAVLTVALVLLVAIVGVGATGAVPLAGMLLAGLLVALAVLRLVLPTRKVGALAVRSRGLDAAVMLIIAAGLAVLSTSPNL